MINRKLLEAYVTEALGPTATNTAVDKLTDRVIELARDQPTLGFRVGAMLFNTEAGAMAMAKQSGYPCIPLVQREPL